MNETQHLAPARVGVSFSPHWVNAWFVRLFATPYASLDGREFECGWRDELVIEGSTGEHHLETYIKYGRATSRLGVGAVSIALSAGRIVQVVSRNGWANHMPFLPTVTDAPALGSARAASAE